MDWIPILAGIIPSIGVGLLFWMAMRAVVRGDRNERAAIAEADALADAQAAAQERAAGSARPKDE